MTNPRLLGVAAALVASVSAFAASPVGTWKGKILIKTPPMPANTPPQQKAMVKQMLDSVAKAKISLVLKAGGTYTVNASGMPGPKPNDKSTGKWTQKGNQVTLLGSKPKEKAQTFTLSPDGKKMTLALPNGQGQILFTK